MCLGDGEIKASIGKLFKKIREKKTISLTRFIYALSIRNIGYRNSEILDKGYGTIEEFLNEIKNLHHYEDDINEIMMKRGLPYVAAQDAAEFFVQEKNVEEIERLVESGIQVLGQKQIGEDEVAKRERLNNNLKGKVFVFTGSLQNFTRKEATKAVNERGGQTRVGVNGEVNCVVCGLDPGRKAREANKRGIEVINEQQFQEMLR